MSILEESVKRNNKKSFDLVLEKLKYLGGYSIVLYFNKQDFEILKNWNDGFFVNNYYNYRGTKVFLREE